MKLHGFENGYTEGSFLWIVNNINFQYFSIFITLFSAVVMVVVSYVTRGAGLRPDQEPDLRHRHGGRQGRTHASWSWQEVAGLGLHPDLHPRRLSLLPGIAVR